MAGLVRVGSNRLKGIKMSRDTRHILTGLIVTAALLTAGQTPVGACSCGGRGVACEAVWNSEAVFVGTVVSLGPEIDSERLVGTHRVSRRERVVRLKVTEAFRGVDVGDLTVRTAASSASCGFSFEAGRAYVVFADSDPFSGALTVSLCSSTGLVEQSAEELAYLRGPFRVPSDLGVVRGTVVHYDRYDWVDHPAPSTPFPGAELRLEGYSRAYTTTSGADGSYRFQVPAGDYRLFVRVRDGVYALSGNDGVSIALRDNRACAVGNVTVRPDSRIAGRLLDGSGRPVPFMSVVLTRASDISAEPLWGMTQILTDERGRFEFRHIDPGRYVIGVAEPHETRDVLDRVLWISPVGDGKPATVEVAAEQRLDVGGVRLPSGVATLALSGVVVDSDGKPVEGAEVRYTSGGSNAIVDGAEATTGRNGQFSLSLIAGRSYRLLAYWRVPGPPPRRLLSATSDPFEAVGEIKPFRLVLTEVR